MFLKIHGFVDNESDTLLLIHGCPPIPHLGVESREIQIRKGTEPGLLRAGSTEVRWGRRKMR